MHMNKLEKSIDAAIAQESDVGEGAVALARSLNSAVAQIRTVLALMNHGVATPSMAEQMIAKISRRDFSVFDD